MYLQLISFCSGLLVVLLSSQYIWLMRDKICIKSSTTLLHNEDTHFLIRPIGMIDLVCIIIIM